MAPIPKTTTGQRTAEYLGVHESMLPGLRTGRMSYRDTEKPTNPKDAIGSSKVPLMSVLSWRVLAEVALGMLEGSLKYGRHNYRAIGIRASVYMDATQRHLTQFWEGEDIDPVSGVHHLSKAISSLMVARDAIMAGLWTDDRPPRCAPGWVDAANDAAAKLIAKYPEPKKPFTQKGQEESAKAENNLTFNVALDYGDLFAKSLAALERKFNVASDSIAVRRSRPAGRRGKARRQSTARNHGRGRKARQ